jgi:hypothetical protein
MRARTNAKPEDLFAQFGVFLDDPVFIAHVDPKYPDAPGNDKSEVDGPDDEFVSPPSPYTHPDPSTEKKEPANVG